MYVDYDTDIARSRYLSRLRRKVASSPSIEQAKEAHVNQWTEIWGRSRLQILRSSNTSQDVTHTSAMYVATRFIALLEQRGGPKKFNGGILTPVRVEASVLFVAASFFFFAASFILDLGAGPWGSSSLLYGCSGGWRWRPMQRRLSRLVRRVLVSEHAAQLLATTC